MFFTYKIAWQEGKKRDLWSTHWLVWNTLSHLFSFMTLISWIRNIYLHLYFLILKWYEWDVSLACILPCKLWVCIIIITVTVSLVDFLHQIHVQCLASNCAIYYRLAWGANVSSVPLAFIVSLCAPSLPFNALPQAYGRPGTGASRSTSMTNLQVTWRCLVSPFNPLHAVVLWLWL